MLAGLQFYQFLGVFLLVECHRRHAGRLGSMFESMTHANGIIERSVLSNISGGEPFAILNFAGSEYNDPS